MEKAYVITGGSQEDPANEWYHFFKIGDIVICTSEYVNGFYEGVTENGDVTEQYIKRNHLVLLGEI